MKKLAFLIFACLFSCALHADSAIISCSGKCGSRTLFQSFKALGIDTFHRHLLTPELAETIQQRSLDEPVLLVDSTRDLIARRISSFFQNLSMHIQMSPEEIQLAYKRRKSEFIDFLITEFNNKLVDLEQYYGSERWTYFGYDYLNDGFFDFKKKYQLVQIGNLYFLNLRFCDISYWEEIIRSLPVQMNLDKFKIITTNKAEEKYYKNIYIEFLKRMKINKNDFYNILNNNINHLNHFYTDKEIESLIKTWEPYLI